MGQLGRAVIGAWHAQMLDIPLPRRIMGATPRGICEWHPLSITNPASQARILRSPATMLPVRRLSPASPDLLNCPAASGLGRAMERPA